MKASTLNIIFGIITLLLLLLTLVMPFLASKYAKASKYLSLLLVSIILTFMFSSLLMFWAHELSDGLMYEIYGFDHDGMSDEERLGNVSLENRQTIEDIYNGNFGIGWPLKLIMVYIMLIPYNIVTCGIIYLFKHKKHNVFAIEGGLNKKQFSIIIILLMLISILVYHY